MRNILAKVPKAAQPFVATMVRSIFAQPDGEQVALQLERVTEQLGERFGDAAELLEGDGVRHHGLRLVPGRALAADLVQQSAGAPEPGDPSAHRRRRQLPNRAAIIRLVGAVLAEQHDEWAEARRYMGVESLTKARMAVVEGDREEVRGELVATA